MHNNNLNIKRDFNIIWYVVCWNEMPILPFIIDYWKIIARKVIIYDNGSTDGSLEYLEKFDWIEIRHFNTDNQLRDDILQKIKNECWKEQRDKDVDFVIVSDIDEVIWSKNLYDELNFYKQNKFAIIKPKAYDFISLDFPKYDGELLHKQIKTCLRKPWFDKCVIFNPNLVHEINYSPGAHLLKNPIFINCMWYSDSLFLFHFKYLSKTYVINKRSVAKNRLSNINKENEWGNEYTHNENETIKEFEEYWKEAKDFNIEELLK